MANELESMLRKKLIEPPQTVSSDFTTEPIYLGDREAAFSLQVVYDGGDGSVDMDFVYELSVDGVNYVTVDAEKQTIADDSGIHIWDISDTGTNYMRVKVVRRAGSIDLQSIFYSGRRRN